MRYDLEKEIETFEFPSQSKMIEKLQAKNLGYDFQNSKHTITERTPLAKLKQYYIADNLSRNLGDISKIETLPYADIIVHSSPCQSFSCAGKGEGGDEGSGTTSSLMWESLRLITTSMPQYIIWENVAAVLGNKHRHNFIKYLEKLSELGYESAFDLLNAKHFGIPQNRLRIFCVSRKINNVSGIENTEIEEYQSVNKQVLSTIREIDTAHPTVKLWRDYKFPGTIKLTTLLKDILDKDVDEKYYLSDEQTEKVLSIKIVQEEKDKPFIIASRGRYVDGTSSTEQKFEPNFSGCTNTLTSVQKDNYVFEPIIIEDFYKSRNPRLYEQTAPTIRSERAGLKVIDDESTNGRVRKLTERECWKLMGFTDEDHDRAAKYVSASARYKQAGNSIVTNCLVALFSSLLIKDGDKANIWVKYAINHNNF